MFVTSAFSVPLSSFFNHCTITNSQTKCNQSWHYVYIDNNTVTNSIKHTVGGGGILLHKATHFIVRGFFLLAFGEPLLWSQMLSCVLWRHEGSTRSLVVAFYFISWGFWLFFILYLELGVEGVTFTYPADFLHNHAVSAACSFLCFMPWTQESHHPAEEDASFTCATDNNYPSHNHSQCQLLVLFLVSWLELNPLEEGAAFMHAADFLHDHAQ